MRKRELRKALAKAMERAETLAEAHGRAERQVSQLESELRGCQMSARHQRELALSGLLVMADALGVRVDFPYGSVDLQPPPEDEPYAVDRADVTVERADVEEGE